MSGRSKRHVAHREVGRDAERQRGELRRAAVGGHPHQVVPAALSDDVRQVVARGDAGPLDAVLRRPRRHADRGQDGAGGRVVHDRVRRYLRAVVASGVGLPGGHVVARHRDRPARPARPAAARACGPPRPGGAQAMPAAVQPLEGVLHHVIGGGQVADHHQGQAHQLQAVLAEQVGHRGHGVAAVLPRDAGPAARALRLARHSRHREVHARETRTLPPALHARP